MDTKCFAAKPLWSAAARRRFWEQTLLDLRIFLHVWGNHYSGISIVTYDKIWISTTGGASRLSTQVNKVQRVCTKCGATVFADSPRGFCSVCLFKTGLGSLEDSQDGEHAASSIQVEFGDYQCPSCKAYHPLVLEALSRYPQDVRLEFHHYPLVSIHANSMAASLAVEAAGEQGKYWEMHDLLFEHQDEWSKSPNPEPDIIALAQRLALNQNAFMQAMRSPQIQDRILQDVVRAQNAKVEAVPTFFIDGQKINVPLGIMPFVDVIESHLHSASSSTSK